MNRPARIIVIDDPTPYRNRHNIRKDGGKTRFGTGVAHKYAGNANPEGVMKEDDLIALAPYIHMVCADDAYLFCWATKPNKFMAYRILKGRGLEDKTEPFTWIKTYPDGRPYFGTGRYSGSNPEDVILGRFPNTLCWHPNTGYKPNSVIETIHPRYLKLPHSRKPEEMQDRLDKWLDPYIGDYAKLELFATRQRPGWTCLGQKLSGRDIRDDLMRYAAEIPRGKETMSNARDVYYYISHDKTCKDYVEYSVVLNNIEVGRVRKYIKDRKAPVRYQLYQISENMIYDNLCKAADFLVRVHIEMMLLGRSNKLLRELPPPPTMKAS